MTQDARQFRGRGFTIIELILALSMVAIVALTLYQSLRVAFRSRDAAMAAVEPARTIDLAMRFIQEDLQNAIAPNAATSSDDSTTAGTTSGTISGGITGALPSLGTGTGPGAQAGTSLTLNITYNTGTTYILAGPFEGVQSTGGNGQEADDMVFYTTSDSTDHVDGNGDLKQVELTVLPVSTSSGASDNVLVRRTTRNLLSEVPVPSDDEVLCRGVVGFTVQYFDGTAWNPTWDSTIEDNTLPAAVQITLSIRRPKGQDLNHVFNYTRVFQVECSTATQDSSVNSGDDLGL
jgi:prepilin-type N-terminal cleavage/methylation domain-containing protein